MSTVISIINIKTTAIECLGLSRISEMLLTGATLFKDTKSAVALAGMHASPIKRCRLPQAGFLPISASKVINKIII